MDSRKVQFIRVNGDTLKTETTEDEKKFRKTQFSDYDSVLKKKVNCTACGKSIKEKIISKDIHVHPVLEVLWCKKCEEFYSDGEFSADEDGSDKYCRWCAQGGSLYCCSYCSVAFCEKCVKRNLPPKMMKDIEEDDWRCFVCVSEPLWTLRAVCDAAKRYVDSSSDSKGRKSIRIQKSQSEEETTESEKSNLRSRQKRKKEAESTEDEKYNADSEDTASLETNKNKRKYVSSSEDNSGERRSRRRKVEEVSKPKPHPDEKRKKKFESIIQEAINQSAALRKLLTKKEATWKKEFIGTNVTKFNKTLDHSEEEFLKFFSDIKTSINLIEKSFNDNIAVLKDKSSKSPEKTKPSAVEEDKSEHAENEDVDMADVSTVSEIAAEDLADGTVFSDTATKKTPEKSPRKESVVSVNGTDDVSLTTFDDDIATDANDKPVENDKSTKSIDDSLAVNVSSIIDSLNSDDENELRNQNISVNEKDPLEIESSKPDNATAENDSQVVSSDKEDDDDLTITEPTEPAVQDETVLEEDKAKMSLLQSSSDNATTDNEKTKKLSTDSELSGVSVLHSDQDDVNKTKQKKKRTRKELNSLASKEVKASNGDATDDEKEIERLGDLNSLKKRKVRHSSDSDDKVVENNSAKKVESASKKKKTEKTSLSCYFGESSGNDTDGSNISFSRFNSVLENKNKTFLNGEEDMSKKMLLEYSSDEDVDQCDDDLLSVSSDDKPSKSSKYDDKKSSVKKNESNGGSSKKKNDSDSSSNEFKKDKNKKEKQNWRSDRLLRGKLSETDTSDEERIIKKDKEKRQKEAERKAQKTGDSSDSEDIFRTNKQSTKKTKRRKAKVASSGSEFEVNNVSDSDDSVQIVSDKETTPPTKNRKKRRRIKKFSDSDNSGGGSDDGEKTPGSANKGRKNIRKMLKEDDLAEITKRTAKEEQERKKRISERQALFNESFKIDEDINKAPDRLILDFDPETKKELIVVHKDLVRKLKPHQAKGVKFMWDSCFESVKMAETSPGGGCILAHCMGLGKTLQVITLVHTVMRYPQLKVNRVLVLCPLSTVLNWVAEFEMWLQDVDYGDDIDVFNLSKANNFVLRADMLHNWFKNGGVMVMGYEMFRNLVNTNKVRKKIKQYFTESLLEPGPDLVICDEGHMLKNEQSAISQATMKIRTKRRIVLTGTPLQNNLVEYHCMVQFVKQNLLGDKKEFLNRFANPITNGQYMDSTSHDVRVMKRRAHVLHKMLDGVVQRFDYNVLTPFLPSKHEFVILVGLSDLQAKLYDHYIEHYSKKVTSTSTLFKDYQIMRLIWTHPFAMKLSEDRKRERMEKKMENEEDSEGSLRDFVVHSDDEESEKTPDSDSDSSVVSIKSDDNVKPKSKAKPGRLTRGKKKELGMNDEELVSLDNGTIKEDYHDVWWKSMVSEEEMNDYKMGPKLVLLFAIIQHCENIGDKLLVFSQSIPSLDMIEHFLEKWEDMQQQEGDNSDKSVDQYGTWQKGVDYFRLDGQTPPELRTMYCNSFNKTSNLRSRLFLISTKAGGLGINLTAANRVIIFDASWNPSYDVQSIFRIYRFGQSKPCYIYRFLSQGTMEEKIYERQVTKLSISCRVVDEQQIDRHFNNADIVALYEFNRKQPSDEIPKLPKDRLMAEILKEHKNIIVGCHEHDSLLENQKEEELTEEERKQAWEDYENEKKGIVNQQLLQQQILQQQLLHQQLMQKHQANQMNAGILPTQLPSVPTEITFNKAVIMDALKKEHPNVSESQLQVMHTMVVERLKKHYVDQMNLQNLQQQAMQQQVLQKRAALLQQAAAAQNQLLQQRSQLQNFEQQARERLEKANLANSSVKK